MLEKSFGERVKGIEYKDRLGAYAIIIDGDKVVVVKTSTGFFLLGGGIEIDETHEECIGYFYNVKLLENLDCETEKDHELVWLKIEESYDKLFLKHQSWALRYAISLRDE